MYYEKVAQKIFAFEVYTKYSIERNYNLGCFSQIHLILYVKLQWNCHLALLPKVAETNYNHPPRSSVGSHVLIPRNLSVLSNSKIIS
jgi:hypothetical protein